MVKELDLHDPNNRALARLVLAQRDMREARSAVHQVLTRNIRANDILFEPLCCAAIVAYCRPFTTSKGYPKLPPVYSSFARKDFANLHDDILRLRHKSVAHSDEELEKVFCELEKGIPALQQPGHGIRSRGLRLDAFGLFRDLCDHQLERLKMAIADRLRQMGGT